MLIRESFVIADWRDPGTHPGRPIAGLHVRRADDEGWFVVQGRLGFRVGDEQREVAVGEWVAIFEGHDLELSA